MRTKTKNIKETEVKKLLKYFADKTNCSVQYKGCPCGSCLLSYNKADYSNLFWLMVLFIRGDYSFNDIKPNLDNNFK